MSAVSDIYADTDKRQKLVDGLRALANDLEVHPEMPLPYAVYVPHYLYNVQLTQESPEVKATDTAREVMAVTPGNWEKMSSNNFVSYTKSYGDLVKYQLEISRSQTCRRIQAGTKIVPAVPEQPEREEPVYTWDCTSEPDVS